MSRKPTYEELEQSIKELEKKFFEKNQLEEMNWSIEEHYRTLVETIPHGIQEIDASGTIVFGNDAYCRLIGYKREEFLGKKIWDFIEFETPCLQKELQEYLGLLLKDQPSPVPYFQRNRRKDGKVKEVQVDWNYKRNKQGIVIGFISVITDITEKRSVENALKKARAELEIKVKQRTVELRKSREKINAILHSISEHMSMIDNDLNIIWTNEIAKTSFGNDLIGKKCFEVFHNRKEPCEPYPCITLMAFKDGNVHSHETQVINKNGRLVHFHCIANIALRDNEGKPTAVLKICRDITEHKGAEESLKRTNSEMNQIFNVSVPLCVIDKNFTMHRVNDRFCSFFNMKKEAVLGKKCFDIWQGSMCCKAECPMKQILSGTEKTEHEETKMLSNGRKVSCMVSAVPLYNLHGEIVGIVENFTDITERKIAEDSLVESEKRFKQFYNVAFEGIAIHDKGIVFEANDQYFKMFGYEPHELLGKQAFSLTVAPEDLKLITKQIATDTNDIYEVTGLRKDGTKFPIEVLIRYIKYRGRDLRVAVMRDITHIRQSEESLRFERDKLEKVTQSIGAGLAIISKNYRTLWANRVLKDIFGDIEGKICYVTYNQREEVCPQCAVHEIFTKDKDLVTHDQVGKDAEGNTIWSQIIATPLKDAEGNITSALEVVVPITKRKQAEQALLESEERFRKLIEASFDGILIHRDGIFLNANKKFFDIIGYTKDELSNKKIFPLLIAPESIELVKSKMKSNFFEQYRFTGLKKDGSRFPVETCVISAYYNGQPVKVLAIRDLTERFHQEEEKRRLKTQLQQAQKMEALGTLASGIAHDFNNILTAIIGNTEIALYREISGETQARYSLEQVLKASHRAKNIIKQILAFSRPGRYKSKPILIGPLIKEYLKLIRVTLPSTIEIRQNIQGESKAIVADPTKIQQVLINLCTNAFYAMRERGGILYVSLSSMDIGLHDNSLPVDLKSGTYLNLTVKDTGYGIDKKIINKIFDPYFTTKPMEDGTGLGLAIVHGIVKGFGGEILVESEYKKGTRFQIFFPVVESKETIYTPDKLPVSGGREQILFVDDEESVVTMGERMIGALGYKVVTVRDSIEALEIFKSHPELFDLVITDKTMPNMTGEVLANKILKIRSDIPIILCTGLADNDIEEKKTIGGIREYIAKPYTINNIARKIRQVLDVGE